MTTESILTIKAVLLYIIKNSSRQRHDVYSIVKTAYYAQQLHFAKWAAPIYDDKISALPFGPVPSTLYNILRLSRGEEKERSFLKKLGADIVSNAIGFENESFFIKEDPDLDYLSKSNIECLNEAIKKVATMDFSEIMSDTHGKEWKRAYSCPSCKIMDNISIAKEAGASDDVLEYLQETLDWERNFA